jgi:hypothetical protein
MHPEWLSNSYLVGDRPGGDGLLIDSGGPPDPLLEAVAKHGVSRTIHCSTAGVHGAVDEITANEDSS